MSTVPGIQQLADIQMISIVKARYVRFVDSRQWDSLASLLVHDFVFEGNRSRRGGPEFVRHVAEQLADASTVHQLHVPEIEVPSASAARAVWPFADLIDQRTDGVGLVRRGFGHYHETYVRREGTWRIATMRITRVRVECETHKPGASVTSHVCLSQEELVAWLAEARGR